MWPYLLAAALSVFQTGFERWTDLSSWDVRAGEAISPVVATPFDLAEAIPSWNADTPPGSWIEVDLRARIGEERWTAWYEMGVWASGTDAVRRQSVRGQSDEDARVATDTLIVHASPVTALQMRVRLHGGATLRSAAIAYSTRAKTPASVSTGNPELWGKRLDLPACSQMVYPDGGRVWCSPTSVSMVLGYWRRDEGPCEPRVRAAVDGVYDWAYRGHGNWSFNAAYAGTQGLAGYVARFRSLAEAEPWIAAGVPVVFSFAWERGELSGAPQPSVNGHLAVLVGFDADGDPIVHDPAASSDAAVPRTYQRAELERVWLKHSAGTVYLIHPTDWSIPAL